MERKLWYAMLITSRMNHGSRFEILETYFLKIQMISEKLLAQLVVVSTIGNIFKYKELWIRRKLKS